MKPTEDWIEIWKCEVGPALEERLSRELVCIFKGLWVWADIDSKSKTTQRRYSSALQSLGGYLVEKAVSEVSSPNAAQELVSEYIGPDEGPLIHYCNEEWQNELDRVCRKLYRYLETQR